MSGINEVGQTTQSHSCLSWNPLGGTSSNLRPIMSRLLSSIDENGNDHSRMITSAESFSVKMASSLLRYISFLDALDAFRTRFLDATDTSLLSATSEDSFQSDSTLSVSDCDGATNSDLPGQGKRETEDTPTAINWQQMPTSDPKRLGSSPPNNHQNVVRRWRESLRCDRTLEKACSFSHHVSLSGSADHRAIWSRTEQSQASETKIEWMEFG